MRSGCLPALSAVWLSSAGCFQHLAERFYFITFEYIILFNILQYPYAPLRAPTAPLTMQIDTETA